MSISTDWLARKRTQEEREQFKQYLLNQRQLFDELDHILNKEMMTLVRQECDYSDGAWAYKQAHLNGMREAFSRVRLLIPRPEDNK